MSKKLDSNNNRNSLFGNIDSIDQKQISLKSYLLNKYDTLKVNLNSSNNN